MGRVASGRDDAAWGIVAYLNMGGEPAATEVNRLKAKRASLALKAGFLEHAWP